MSRCLTLNVLPSNKLTLNIAPKLEIIQDIPVKQKRITKYTLEIFLQRAQSIHGNKYDYSRITAEHIKGRDSYVPVKCNICTYEWNANIASHIIKKGGCPDCAGNARWTLTRFLRAAKELHGDTVDYCEVTEEHIKNNESHVPLTCTRCLYKWSPDIHAHMKGQGCPNCSGQSPWTLERFLIRARNAHGDDYDYSAITEDHINTKYSSIPVTCKKCIYKWESTIDTHVKGHGCPRCKSSTGEKECARILTKMGINYDTQFRIPSLPRRAFDFKFEYMGKRWLLEFDGRQHFEMIPFFSRTMEEFLKRQQADIMKTNTAIAEGYNVIHIDDTQFDNIEQHIRNAANLGQKVYFSTPELYAHYN